MPSGSQSPTREKKKKKKKKKKTRAEDSKSSELKRKRGNDEQDVQARKKFKSGKGVGLTDLALGLTGKGLRVVRDSIKTKKDQIKDKSKPIFMSRKQRDKLALKELEGKREHKRKMREEAKLDRHKFTSSNRDSHRSGGRSVLRRDEEDRQRKEAREKRHRERREREVDNLAPHFIDKEQEVINRQYLPDKKNRRKGHIPPSQRFKFNFDWAATDDTSEQLNVLYTHKHKASLLFGRGLMGGVDPIDQKKKNKDVWDPLLKNRTRKNHGIDEELYKQIQKKQAAREKRRREKAARAKKAAIHWSDKDLKNMNNRDWRILMEDHRINARGGKLPNPLRSWKESGMPKTILKAITSCGYREPTPIQRMAIPVGLSNRDCVGIAMTGSGKTAAFALPMLCYLLRQPEITPETAPDGPYAVCLAPTRELAKQIELEVNKFAANVHIRCITIVGGVDIRKQSAMMRDGVECIIGTPGRIVDLLENRYLSFNQCNYVVLDEADRMVEIGFEPQVQAILEAMPSSNLRPINEDDAKEDQVYRQTFMFSATMPPAVERLTKQYLRNPCFISVGERGGKASKNVMQHTKWVAEGSKKKDLVSLLRSLELPAMVFVEMKKNCDSLVKYISSQDGRFSKAAAIHGGKKQEHREDIMNGFKEGRYNILVATRVAGRGIDVQGVRSVIIYDMPATIDEYRHQIGRTGRMDSKTGKQLTGVAWTFLNEENKEVFYDLKKELIENGHVPCRELNKHASSKVDPRDPNARPRGSVVMYAKDTLDVSMRDKKK